MENNTDERFPNGFQSWSETHHEVVSFIACKLTCIPEHRDESDSSVVFDTSKHEGTGGLYRLAERWTYDFELLNKGREWDGEFFDEIELFCEDRDQMFADTEDELQDRLTDEN